MLLKRKIWIVVFFVNFSLKPFPGANPVTLTTTTPVLNSNFSASSSQSATFTNAVPATPLSILWDGGNNTFSFARSGSSQVILAQNVNLTTQNIVIEDYAQAKVSFGASSTIVFGQGTNLKMNQDLILGGSDTAWTFSGGTSTIDGKKCQLTVSGAQKISILGNTTLILKNVDFYTTVVNPFLMQNTSCTVNLQNSRIMVGAAGFTFDAGTLNVSGQSQITGQHTSAIASNSVFTFSSIGKMTIATNSCLTIDKGINFIYQANPASDTNLFQTKRHVVFTDYSSCLFLNGASLTSTATALAFDTGRLVIGDRVVATSATGSGQELEFGSSLKMDVLAGAVLELQGPTKYVIS